MTNMPQGFGRPTMSTLAVAGAAVRQSLASQAAWFIDPINGRDWKSGTTLANAIQTRNEFARRMFGVSLTQNVTVTVTSSLLAGDDRVPLVFGSVGNSWAVNWVGVPTSLFTGVITAYTAAIPASGGTNYTKMTIAGLPVSWTASGLLQHIIEVNLGGGLFTRSTVVADLGAKQAWLSPPKTQGGAEANFINGQTVTIWSLPNMRVVTCIGGFNTYKYLDATFWNQHWGATIKTNCTGPDRQFAGNYTITNCCNEVTPASVALPERLITIGGKASVNGGYNYLAAVGDGTVNITGHSTVSGLQAEGGKITASGASGVFANVEINGGLVVAADACLLCNYAQGGEIILQGRTYGSSILPRLIKFLGSGSKVRFSAFLPAVTGATDVAFNAAAKTELASRLDTIELFDSFGNEAIGPLGPVMTMDRNQLVTQARGIIAETIDGRTSGSTAQMTSGVASYVAIGLRAGEIVTNIGMFVGSAVLPVGLTLCKVGLYDKAGNRLAVSADQSAAWATSGYKSNPMIAPFTILTTDVYYLAILSVHATGPSIARGALGTGLGPFQIGGLPSAYYGQLGLADLPNPATFNPAVVSSNVAAYYMHVT